MAYLKSTQVKVYPSAYRGVNDKGELFNPEAQLNTEFNITNLQANDSYRSYVISWKDSILKCVIHGYYFELTLDATTINSFTSNIYASINIQAATNVDATNTKYAAYTLVPYTQVATGIPSKLDDTNGEFIGLNLTEEKPTSGATATLHILYKTNDNTWQVPEESWCVLNTTQIKNKNTNSPISKSFTTSNISTTTLNVSGKTTTQGNVDIHGDLVVSGSTTLSNTLSIQGDINISQGNITTSEGTVTSKDIVATNDITADRLVVHSIEPISTQGSSSSIGLLEDAFDKIYGKDIYATKFHGELDGNVPTLESEIDSIKKSLIPEEAYIPLSTEGSTKILDSVSYTMRYSFHLMLEDTAHKINSSTTHNTILVDLGQVCWGVRELVGGSIGNPFGSKFHVQVYGQQADLLNATYTYTYEYIVDIYDVESSGVTSLYADVYWRDASDVEKLTETSSQKKKWQKLTSGNLYISSPLE